MNETKPTYIQKSLSRSTSLQKTQPIPSALFRLRHLVQLHDRESFSRIDEMWSRLHVLYVITAGQARLISADGKLTLNAGSAVVRQAGDLLQQDSNRGSLSPIQGIAIAFDCTENKPLIWPFGRPAPIISHVVTDRAGELVQACSTDKDNNLSPFRPHMLFYEMLDIMRDHVAHSAHEEHSWLDAVLRQIHQMYTHPLTREQLARESNVSPEHFSREFKKLTGFTFVEYVTRLRIRTAQEHLLLANPTLQEIAQLTGYRDTFYLSRKFKQMVGSAPTHYRKTSKKIVSLTYNYTASLLALGHTPHLGAVDYWMEARMEQNGHSLSEKHSEYELFNNLKLIADAEPDVIVGYAPHSTSDELRLIAPTILMPFEELDWQQQFLHLGQITGLESNAQEILSRYSQLEQEANHTLDNMMGYTRGSAVCIFWIGASGAYIYGHGWGRASHVLYRSLGFTPPPRMEQDSQLLTGYVHVPLSEIHWYAADHMFVAYPEEPSERQMLDNLLNQESWGTLSAVREGRVYEIDADMFYGFDPLSVMEQLQHIMQHLTSYMSME
ncbi:AraC family transcriptional regulator [Paenibacillus sp. PCH8]|uniref:AraC family transcriptional regulator n=1 Tax=Paenibacillus sp. PCH8 TaxID=2066524 RepID=UPI0015E3850B|nr:AraC family transcriptional regulator [Paenibacillus sp. PCH8]